jgi:drug/metabolite transporter (DMT)-like permease
MGWLILLRVSLSVSANAVQKRLLLNRSGVYHTWILTYLLMLGPATAFAALRFAGGGVLFWRDIVIGGGLDAVGNLAMIAALRSTDISIFGPLNAFRPILAVLFGFFFLHESPSAIGLAGLGITVAGGVILMTDRNPAAGARFTQIWKPLLLRVTGLALGVAGAVFLKRAALHSSAELTVAAWIGAGLVVLFVANGLHRGEHPRTLGNSFRRHSKWLLTHAAVFVSMQWLTIRIFQMTLLAYSFVFFQLGMVLQVFVGRIFFNEPSFVRRLIASMVMAGGSILILWRG